MLVLLPGDWRVIALRGLVAVAFGVVTLVWPSLTLWTLVLLFGVYALLDGLSALAAAFGSERPLRRSRGWLAFEGICGIAAGIVAFAWPHITALALLYLIAAWAMLTGILEIAAAIALRHVLRDTWLLGLTGLASVVFGVLLVITPGAGALVITWLIGWFAMFFGVMLLALAWRLRGGESALRESTTVSFRQAAV
jgi:uncharacterized membrane protein HdeD (DUF308 family)